MEGQLSLFDFFDNVQSQKRRPCDYKFKRYVGQRVNIMIGAYRGQAARNGVIKEIIDSYYTLVSVGNKEFIGTPYNLSEVTN